MRRSSLQHAFNAYAVDPSEAENTSAQAVREEARAMGINNVDHKSKAQLIRALHRMGDSPVPQMSEADAECASRFANLSKEEVVNSAVMLGLVKPSSTKIDACKALHDAGIQTENHLVVVMNDMKPLESQKWEQWQCERPTNVVSNYSCGIPMKDSNGQLIVKPALGWENKKYSSERSCNQVCVKGPGDNSRFTDDARNALMQKWAPSVQNVGSVKGAGPSISSNGPKVPEGILSNAPYGKKCRRSKVGKVMQMRDKKGRFCKKSSKRRARK
jgi:hypothetical protein